MFVSERKKIEKMRFERRSESERRRERHPTDTDDCSTVLALALALLIHYTLLLPQFTSLGTDGESVHQVTVNRSTSGAY